MHRRHFLRLSTLLPFVSPADLLPLTETDGLKYFGQLDLPQWYAVDARQLYERGIERMAIADAGEEKDQTVREQLRETTTVPRYVLTDQPDTRNTPRERRFIVVYEVDLEEPVADRAAFKQALFLSMNLGTLWLRGWEYLGWSRWVTYGGVDYLRYVEKYTVTADDRSADEEVVSISYTTLIGDKWYVFSGQGAYDAREAVEDAIEQFMRRLRVRAIRRGKLNTFRYRPFFR